MVGENLSNSFEYPKKMFSEAGRLVILIVLNIIPIVDWIVLGYQARVLKESPGTGVPPKLEKYGELFVEGAKCFSPPHLHASSNHPDHPRLSVNFRRNDVPSRPSDWGGNDARRNGRRSVSRRDPPGNTPANLVGRRNGSHD